MPTDCVSACRGRRILLLICPKGLLRAILRPPCGVSALEPKAPCGWVLPISLAERHFFECGRTPPAACLQPGNHARRQRPPRQCTRSPRPPDLPALPPGQHGSAAGAMAAPRRRLRSPRSRSSAARSTIFGVGGDGQHGPVHNFRRTCPSRISPALRAQGPDLLDDLCHRPFSFNSRSSYLIKIRKFRNDPR